MLSTSPVVRLKAMELLFVGTRLASLAVPMPCSASIPPSRASRALEIFAHASNRPLL